MLPILTIADEGGPMNTTPFFSHCSAKEAFSDKNPKPGCKASQLESLAIYKIFYELR